MLTVSSPLSLENPYEGYGLHTDCPIHTKLTDFPICMKHRRLWGFIQNTRQEDCVSFSRVVDRALGKDTSHNEEEAPERRRPIAFVRRQQAGPTVPEDPPAQAAYVEPGIPIMEDVGTNLQAFPGGPKDTSVLTKYADHVVARVWVRELASHGRKVRKFGRPALEIEDLVATTGLSPLIKCSVETSDRGLLSGFVERWHSETSSFHLPIGELTITLDDVSSLLHLPIIRAFQTYDAIDVGEAVQLLVELLEVTAEEAIAKTEKCHGTYVRLSWL